ncbi:MAG: zinc metallopeptidase [Deltaproteobacteria bacterium]|nr:zinc metallopeptidase [Deltaproteobacteria bacterium]
MFYIIVIAIVAMFGPHLWAKHILNRHNRQEYFSGSGIDLARMILERLNISDVSVEVTDTADHYDPTGKTIRLTEKTYGRKTLTAVVVAAHEVGHALQDHSGYQPLKTRTRMIGTAHKLERMGAAIMVGVPVLAAVTRAPSVGILMFVGGFATLCIPVLVHLLTLPTELDASFSRALPLLSSGQYIPAEDVPAAKKILLACALTYVANSLIGLFNVWRWIQILRR